jgi:hypothetical protein
MPDENDEVVSVRYDAAGADGGGSNVIKAGVKIQSGDTWQLESAIDIQTTSWQHIVYTWRGDGLMVLWIDAVEDTPTYVNSKGTGPLAGNERFIVGLGAKDDEAGEGWSGLIDEVVLWDRVLSPAEISDVFSLSK